VLKGVHGVVFYFCREVRFASLCAKNKNKNLEGTADPFVPQV
jgi:hypothetical protein